MPNVYVLLLDGYPRQDTLASGFGFDNEPFLAALERLGFRVNREAATRYPRTELTLASLVTSDASELEAHGYATELRKTERRRALRRERLVNSPVMDGFRSLGYRLGYVPPPVTFVHWDGWDDRRDPGQLNDYEAIVIQRTPLRFILGPWLLDQTRNRVEATLDTWSSFDGQRLVFAHVMAPHPPFLWTTDGTVDNPLECWYEVECSLFNSSPDDLRISENVFVERTRPQIAALNERVLSAAEELVSTDPEAVIVIFSDHGTRYSTADDLEATRSLFAARNTTATHADGLFTVLLDELREGAP